VNLFWRDFIAGRVIKSITKNARTVLLIERHLRDIDLSTESS
jgi:hypothetical protein